MSRIVFTDLANDDLDDIYVTIAPDNEAAANRIIDEIHELTLKLTKFPLMGRAADELKPGARVFVLRKYLLIYRPMNYGIAVLRIAHGARDLLALEYPPAPAEEGDDPHDLALI